MPTERNPGPVCHRGLLPLEAEGADLAGTERQVETGYFFDFRFVEAAERDAARRRGKAELPGGRAGRRIAEPQDRRTGFAVLRRFERGVNQLAGKGEETLVRPAFDQLRSDQVGGKVHPELLFRPDQLRKRAFRREEVERVVELPVSGELAVGFAVGLDSAAEGAQQRDRDGTVFIFEESGFMQPGAAQEGDAAAASRLPMIPAKFFSTISGSGHGSERVP